VAGTAARIRLRTPFVVMAGCCFVLFLGLPLVIAVAALAPAHVSVWVALGCAAFVALLGYLMSSSMQWVELQGGMIRARSLLTRKVVERRVADTVMVTPLNSAAMGAASNAVLTAAMGTANRGYELRFGDGRKVGLVRGDMAGLDEFMEALRAELGDRWAEVTKTK
jgi:hypothetical protein